MSYNTVEISGVKHKERHELLHRMLDELVADYIWHTTGTLSRTTLLDFIKWSAEQKRKSDGEIKWQQLDY